MWLDEELHPAIPVNSWITRFDISEDIDVELLREAFFSVIERHDAWRMTVVRAQDGYRAELLDEIPECFDLIDFSETDDPEAEYECWHQEQATLVFPLGAPLFYAAILTLRESRRVFYVVQHHGTKDGTCDNVLVAEMDRAYQSLTNTGTLPAVENHAYSFADHMQHQRDEQDSPQGQERQEFWNGRYATPPEACELYGASTDSKLPTVHREYADVDPAVVRQIRKFLPNSAIFNVVAFAFLRTITRNDDICVGVALHNRTNESRQGVGLFMELVPNRLQIDSEDTFNSLFKKLAGEFALTTRSSKQAVTHPNARFELVINYRQPVDWKLAGESVSVEQMPSLAVSHRAFDEVEPGHEWSRLESLSIDVVQTPGTDRASIAFDFNAGVWPEAQTRARAVRLFLRLLDAYVTDPDQKIDEIGEFELPDSEDAIFLKDMSGVAQDAPPQPLIEAWRSRLEQIADLPALQRGNTVVSHGQLNELVARVTAGLVAHGVESGDRIVTIAETSIEQTAAFLAVASLGAISVPVDPSAPPARLAGIVRSTQPVLVLHDSAITSSLRSLEVTAVALDHESLRGAEQHFGARTEPSQPAYIIHTSGSTGAQKAVVVSHGALSSFAKDWASTLRLTSDDTVLHFYSIAFDSWLTGIVPVLEAGATQVIPAFDEAPLCSDLLAEIEDKGVTVADVPTSYLQSVTAGLRDGATHPGAPFRCWTFGGSALSMDIAIAAVDLIPKNVRLINSYGPSEATVSVCVADLRDCDVASIRQIPIGRPNESVGMRVVNASGSPVPFGVAGELWVSGPQLATGYWLAPDLTDERFVTDADGRWYRTGDLVRWGTDRRLEYLGRNDRQVQIRGHRVEPGEIEAALREYEDIVDSYVGTIGKAGQEQLVAYCVLQPGATFSADSLRTDLARRLPAYMVPQTMLEIQNIPLNTSGKVDVGALPQIHLTLDIGETRPRFELERMIQEIWQRVFETCPIGLDQGFLDLGGHSLLAIEICGQIEACTGKRITPAELFAHPTVRSVAEHLQSDSDPDYSVVSLNSCNTGAPLFCVCGIFLYQPLAKALELQCPVYGVYAREEASFFGGMSGSNGKDNVDAGGEPLKKLVDQYVEAIRDKQPQGPYRLTGISFGGIVAFEVAQRLMRSGEEVEIVGLIDTVLTSAIRRRWLLWTTLKACAVLKRGVAGIRSWFAGSHGEPHDGHGGSLVAEEDAEDKRLTETLDLVVRSYTPDPFPGHLILFSATDRESFPGCDVDPRLGWAEVAHGGLSVCPVSGTHLSVLSEHNVDQVAAALKERMRD